MIPIVLLSGAWLASAQAAPADGERDDPTPSPGEQTGSAPAGSTAPADEPPSAPRRFRGPTAAPPATATRAAPEPTAASPDDEAKAEPTSQPEAAPPDAAAPEAPRGAQTRVGGGGTPGAHSESVAELRARRRVPRALSAIEGYPPDEVADHRWGKVKFTPGFQVRNQIGWVSPFPIDRLGNEYDEGVMSAGRIRWNPELQIGADLRIVGMLDLVNGQWAPDSSESPIIQEIYDRGQPPGRAPLDSPYPDFIDPRELYLEHQSAFGLLRVGQMSFNWGLGILANDGNNLDRFGDIRFGNDGPGDLQERILFATKPFGGPIGSDLVVAIGGDLVFRDERAQLVEGDLAGQVIAVLRYQPEANPGNWLGGYLVYRNQDNASDGDVYPDDDELQVGVVDVAGQGWRRLRDDLHILGAFEAVLIGGQTTIARDDRGDHNILQGGLALRGYLGDHERWLVGLDAGYASGDPNPSDRWINNFTFDAGHTVGLILFQAVEGWRTARSEMLATNGELTGEPLNGTQFIPTRGAVSNAVYVHPKARWGFAERFEIWGGPLIAAAATPIVDPYTTRLEGGVPTNSLGGDGNERYYGTELDLGARARFDIKQFWLQAGIQGGLLVPGEGLANAAGETGGPMGAVWLRTELRY